MSNREIDLSKPSVAGLIYLLRHRELWPRGFDWCYPDRARCAYGLAKAVWGFDQQDSKLCADAATVFNLPYGVAAKIFLDGCGRGCHGGIKPWEIAHALERYMLTGEC